MTWVFPLKNCNGIPINYHPGAFGFHRKKNYHTGVDLYCQDGDTVYAVETGIIVKYGQFTGKEVGHNWWNNTWAVMIEGPSGVVNYGELYENNWKLGDYVERGTPIGKVKQVLFNEKLRTDIPGHSCSMLHLELYCNGSREFADWDSPTKIPDLLDPTAHLILAIDSVFNILTWNNKDSKTVG